VAAGITGISAVPTPQPASGDTIPSTLVHPAAVRFWLAVLLTGIGTGKATGD
jgi:hypothetical protein